MCPTMLDMVRTSCNQVFPPLWGFWGPPFFGKKKKPPEPPPGPPLCCSGSPEPCLSPSRLSELYGPNTWCPTGIITSGSGSLHDWRWEAWVTVLAQPFIARGP